MPLQCRIILCGSNGEILEDITTDEFSLEEQGRILKFKHQDATFYYKGNFIIREEVAPITADEIPF